MIELVRDEPERPPRRRALRLRQLRTREFEHALLWSLLVGALASPVVARFAQWSGPWPFNVPPRLYLFALIGGAAMLISLRFQHRAQTAIAATIAPLGAVVGAASVIAIILERSANAFYTVSSLLNAMAVLLLLHIGARVMRRLARPLTPHVTLPAIALADGLASVSAWSMLAFWVLVWLEHRHVASGVLVFSGVLLLLACGVLIPDSLAGRGFLPRTMDRTAKRLTIKR